VIQKIRFFVGMTNRWKNQFLKLKRNLPKENQIKVLGKRMQSIANFCVRIAAGSPQPDAGYVRTCSTH
jgi:hypothetical protein